MEKDQILQLLQNVQNGTVSIEQAALQLRQQPFEDIGYAKVDHHRAIRQGVPEVIYGAGKTAAQIIGIISSMKQAGVSTILITRLEETLALEIQTAHDMAYYADAKIGIVGTIPVPSIKSRIVIATGGTSDIPVAEEAALTAQALGNHVKRLYDVGVAGLHRLLSNLDVLMDAKVIIAVAGMEGALASVIGGLVDCPVIAVPTSIGYGASFGGVSALLSMLNSCASGVSVVNIDNGFGAGYLASIINHL